MTGAGVDLGQLFDVGLFAIDDEQRRLMETARAEFVTHGFRRTSVGDIARSAKVSRQTVYRRLGDKEDIVRTVTVNEVVTFFTAISEQVLAHDTPADRAVEAFALGVRECRTNPLMAALRQFEPDTLLSLLADQASALEPVRALIAIAIVADDMPMDAALRAADLMLRLTASLLMVPSEMVPIETDEQARRFAATYFTPLIEAAKSDQC
ncbi:TetR family transcriptional regulator [Nocardia puris]|uniref:TetR family transcriptional regulator n=1 Tax=Nocardia puris TaxID=208602 RepID=A0A366E134_9NOCA|nr:TetR family transcriptional regulator [Nocardia puris]